MDMSPPHPKQELNQFRYCCLQGQNDKGKKCLKFLSLPKPFSFLIKQSWQINLQKKRNSFKINREKL